MTRRSFLNLGTGAALAVRRLAAAVPPKLRVTKVEPIVVQAARNHPGWILVRIRTSEGIDGVGECASPRSATFARVTRTRDMADSIGARLNGGNPLQICSHLDHWGHEANGLDWAAAMSGVEIALWDILAQVAGLPLYQVLGGAVRDRVPLCLNDGVFGGATDPRQRLQSALRARESGFRMLKWDPFATSVAGALAEVRLFREALGQDYRLAIDMHGRFAAAQAADIIGRLEEFSPAFIAQPVANDQLESCRKLASSTSVPLASGEQAWCYREARRMIDVSGIRVLEPDAASCGGILEFTRAAGYAEISGVRVAPHGWCGPVATRANTHVAAIAVNLLAQEYPATPADTWENDLIQPGPAIVDGEMELPAGPGLGFKLNDALLATRRLA